MPVVSVVIPTRNRAAYLRQAMESVCAQSFQDWELLVVNDGSTDDTPDVVVSYRHDPRIRQIVQEHRGRAAAVNQGVEQGSGRLVAFLDDDDLWMPDKLAKQVVACEANAQAGLCYTLAQRMDETGRPIGSGAWPSTVCSGWVLTRLLDDNFIVNSSVMVRRSCLSRVGRFDTTLPFGSEDWHLWLRIARSYPVVLIDTPLVRYRVHEGNANFEQLLRSGSAVLEALYRDPRFAGEARVGRGSASANLYLRAAGAPQRSIRRSTRAAIVAHALAQSPQAILTRPMAAALARLLLPQSLWAGMAHERQSGHEMLPSSVAR